MISQPCRSSVLGVSKVPVRCPTKKSVAVSFPGSRAERLKAAGFNGECESLRCAGFQGRFQHWILNCGGAENGVGGGSESVDDGAGSRGEAGEKFVLGRIARRTLLVSFKCDRCEGRTDRMVNPLAWERGTVFVQCSGCEVWHKLKDNMNLIDEIRYADVAEE